MLTNQRNSLPEVKGQNFKSWLYSFIIIRKREREAGRQEGRKGKEREKETKKEKKKRERRRERKEERGSETEREREGETDILSIKYQLCDTEQVPQPPEPSFSIFKKSKIRSLLQNIVRIKREMIFVKHLAHRIRAMGKMIVMTDDSNNIDGREKEEKVEEEGEGKELHQI